MRLNRHPPAAHLADPVDNFAEELSGVTDDTPGEVNYSTSLLDLNTNFHT